MPKPAELMTWATDANFASGPASGNPTQVDPAGWPDVDQGNVPNTAIVAEFINRVFAHIANDWLAWVNEGGAVETGDARIVETDSSGNTEVNQLTVTERIQYASARTIVRQIPMLAQPDGTTWQWSTGDEPVILQVAGATGALLKIPLIGIPDGSTLKSVTVKVDGGNGHASDPIGAVPLVLTIYSQDSTGALTSLGAQNDTTTRATFQAVHSLTKSSINHVVDYEDECLWAMISSEPASIWVANNSILSVSWTADVNEQAE